MKKPQEPPVSFEFVQRWFEHCRDTAMKARRNDSARLWQDGLDYLIYYKKLAEIGKKK